MCTPLDLERAGTLIGRAVEYRPNGRRTGKLSDKGLIRTTTKHFVMVAYADGPDGEPRVRATVAEDLVLIAEDVEEVRHLRASEEVGD